MKKKYLIEFTHSNGEKEVVELVTDRLDWSIDQWKRNRSVIKHEIIEEGSTNTKQMLFG
tara:strand:- start:2522 stop:2698 length:177 start_codon:yes stop_codon:yes gene_type:complete